ncbi:uncharacterized protein LOC115819407 [Chanos chanos]|uniref:Uncharacterized protein LOC115819407 n=1 Tax=Chanos chanos TaxID=29144 RepID=A0A6J2W412_CHACN|nr:uncharacterized protein LOC115819407 [Chanos chanos]
MSAHRCTSTLRIPRVHLMANPCLDGSLHGGIGYLTSSQSVVKNPGQSVTLSCTVSGFSMSSYYMHWIRQKPEKELEWIGRIDGGTGIIFSQSLQGQFSITKDTSKNILHLGVKSLKAEDTVVYHCARESQIKSGGGDYAFDYWGKGTTVTVSSGVQSPPKSIFGLWPCGPSSGGLYTIGCMTSGFSPADSVTFQWTDASGNALSDIVQYPAVPKDGSYTKFSHVNVVAQDWKDRKQFKCIAKAGETEKETIVPPPVYKQSASLYLTIPTEMELVNGTATFICLAKDFSPKEHLFKWLKDNEEVTDKKYIISTSLNGEHNGTHTLYTASSVLQLDSSAWNYPAPATIRCEFNQQDKTLFKETKLPTTDPCTCEPKIEIIPPTAEDMLKERAGTLKCVVSGCPIKADNITWKSGEDVRVSDITHGQDSTVAATSISYDDWNSLTFTCEVHHKGFLNPESVKYRRENGGQYRSPSVYLLPPPEQTNGSVTLTCYAKDFYPKEVVVSWLVNDEPVDKKQEYEQKSTNVLQSKGLFSVYGHLTFGSHHWENGDVYSCQVYHETSETVRIITRTIDKSSQKPALVQLNMNMPKICKDSEKCLVYVEAAFCDPGDIEDNSMANTAFTFIFLFLITLFYGIGATMIKEEVTAACVVHAPYGTKVSWLKNGLEDKTSIIHANSETQSIISNLTLSENEWNTLSNLTCKAVHPCFEEVEKTITLQESVKESPTVVIRRSFSEFLKNNSAVLECVVGNISSGEVSITFQVNGEDHLEAQYIDLSESNELHSLTTQFTVPNSKYQKNNQFTCKVLKSPTSTWLSSPISNLFGDPVVELSVKPSSETPGSEPQKLLCSGTGFNPKIKWLSKSGQNIDATTEITMGQDGRVTITSEVSVKKQDWYEGSQFTCEVNDPDLKTIKKDISVCSVHQFSSPSIHIERPSLRNIMTQEKVTAACVVHAPYGTKVSWLKNGLEDKTSIKHANSETQSIISNLTLSKNEWNTLTTLTCKAVHLCFKEVQKTITLKESVKESPTVVIRRSFSEFLKNNSAVLECIVGNISSGEVSITFQVNGEDHLEAQYIDLSESNELHSLTTQFTVPNSKYQKNNQFTCKVLKSPTNWWPSSPISNLFGDPVVELSVKPSSETPGSEPQKLLCSGTGFNPKIKWLSKSGQNIDATTEITMGQDGRVTITSEVSVKKQDWYEGSQFTCEVSDPVLEKPIRKSISVCTVTEPSYQMAEVYLLGPSLGDLQSGSQVPITCLVIGQHIRDFSFEWRLNNTATSKDGMATQQPKNHDNGTQSVQSILKVPASTWHAHTHISCEFKHFCYNRTLERSISKSKNPKCPSLKIIRPSDADLASSRDATLLCIITGFFPSDVIVNWELDGKRLEKSRFTNSPVKSDNAKTAYSMHSTLTLPASDQREGDYSCVVSHESSKQPVISTVNNVYASVTPSSPSATLLQGPGELVCMAFGYSPSDITITWLLNSDFEQSDFTVSDPAKGPDGKFSVFSRLRLLPSDWAPGAVYTCRINHTTGIFLFNVSKPEIIEESIYFDDNKADEILNDTAEETWNMACAFLILFFFSLIYGCSVTLVKVKTA